VGGRDLHCESLWPNNKICSRQSEIALARVRRAACRAEYRRMAPRKYDRRDSNPVLIGLDAEALGLIHLPR
jgi:hypothetical protein